MSDNLNIYVVEDTTTGERWIVVAESATGAIANATTKPSTAVVGRLGTYDPGIIGARITGNFVICHQT